MNAQSNIQDKSGEPRPSVAVMEGKGFYNKHAAIPAAGGALAIPLFEQAAQMIDLDAGARPMVLAEFLAFVPIVYPISSRSLRSCSRRNQHRIRIDALCESVGWSSFDHVA